MGEKLTLAVAGGRARPSIPPHQIGAALGDPNDHRATQLIRGQVLSLESPALSLWSHTCVCADASCAGARVPFVITALDGVELGSDPPFASASHWTSSCHSLCKTDCIPRP